MSDRTYTAKLKDRDVRVTSRDLAVFRDMCLGTSELSTRMSELLWFDIYVLNAAFGVDPHSILDAIKAVEQGEPPQGTKPATRFNNLPLKGLWHKHYFDAHFLVQNLILGLGKNGVEQLVNDVMSPARSPIITREMVNELAHRVTHEPLENRQEQNKLTGEWIIFIKHEGINYYLCCNTHNAGDQLIFDRIVEHCARDFPQLPEWMRALREP